MLQNIDAPAAAAENTVPTYDDRDASPTPSTTVADCWADNSTNCSRLDEADYIRTYLGWRYRGLGESVTLTVVYTHRLSK